MICHDCRDEGGEWVEDEVRTEAGALVHWEWCETCHPVIDPEVALFVPGCATLEET